MAMVGDRIDKFTLVRRLGAGGMGATWEAVRQVGADFEQRVAIKVAERRMLATAEGLSSFRREAALAASLRHPNIAAVLDVDEHAGYIVCELVDGADLRAVLRAAPAGRLEPAVAVHVLGQIARGLSHAHRRILRGLPSPVMHCDMSPGNVVIDYDGNVKIVDFGIARVMVPAIDPSESLKGKLAYMAPEQVMGARMDGRVDQYALGVIAYEVLCGARPYEASNEGETVARMLAGKRIPLAQRAPYVPAGLALVVERMLAVRPEQRFATMDAVLDALAEFTPSLTAYRMLAPLVIAARQPHTIVRENGSFVCRPVDAAAMLQSVIGAPPRRPASSARPQLPLTAAARAPAVPPALPRMRAQAQHDGESALQRPAASGMAQALAATQSEPPPRLRPLSLPLELTSADAPAGRDGGRARGASLRSRLASSRMLWRGLTGLGLALLAIVLWVAFVSDVVSFIHPARVAPSDAPRTKPHPPGKTLTSAWRAQSEDLASQQHAGE